ncbi:L-amino acid N-acyltransferase YncA [Oxalobacteraceae bacterium GrIS 2.11]
MHIRMANQADFTAMWPIFKAVISSGTTYAFSPKTDRLTAFDYWFNQNIISTYVAEEDKQIFGMYKLVANQRGLGAHVANASFMVDPVCSSKGIGKRMGTHSLKEAKRMGFKAMQFNFVVSTNEPAVALWKKLGFSIVGQLPQAFQHQKLGFVDAYVMHRFLDDIVVD